jgi:hypothetical protein
LKKAANPENPHERRTEKAAADKLVAVRPRTLTKSVDDR